MSPAFPFALLFVPAHDPRLRRKAATLEGQALILDVEDACPNGMKQEGRDGARELITACPGRAFVRINPMRETTAFSLSCGATDIEAVTVSGLRGIVLPKAESAADIREADHYLSRCETAAGLARGTAEMLAIVETAKGIMAVREIAEAAPGRPFRLCFGAGDFATDMGVAWSDTEEESRTARGLLVIASRAAALPAPVDSVYPNLANPEGLARSTRAARAIGFKSKFVIHPTQVPIVEQIFRPSPEEVDWAKRVIAGMREAEQGGRAAFKLDGKLIDYPILERARDIMSAAGDTA